MKKNNITNKITPCCGLPFDVTYWWVSNLILNTPSDRDFILSKISQGGIISIDAWKVLINSGSLETDAALTKAEFLSWFDCGHQPSCDQLKLIIEGYKIGNYNPLDEYGVGWTEVYVFEEYNDKLIKKVTGYTGGIGVLPDELQDRINKYYADGFLTDNKDLAIDFKANDLKELPNYEDVAKPIGENVKVLFNNEIYQVREGYTATADDLPNVNFIVWKKISSNDGKVNNIYGKNKINYNNAIKGYFIFNTAGHEITPNPAWNISEKIPVTGNMVSNKTLVGSGIANIVLDADGNYLRRFDTPNYTYISGDGFVVYSFQDAWDDFQVEEGNISTYFEPFTDKNDVMEYLRSGGISVDLYSAELVVPIDNGAIKRRLGFDIPASETGNNSYIQAKIFANALKGNYRVSVIANHINHSNFLALDSETNITSLGAGVSLFERTFKDEIINVIVFPISLTSGLDRSFRISNIEIQPLDGFSYNELLKVVKKRENYKNIDISKGFDSSTAGWGVTRFNNVVTAWEVDHSDYLNGRNNRHTVFNIMPGFYDDWAAKWAGNDAEDPNDGTYQGITPANHQYFKSFDLDNPLLTILHWDGHSGYSTGFVMSTTQAMKKCIFHISDNIVLSHIEGFKIDAKNVRYCIHPESAGTGNKNVWHLKNLSLNWGGRPNVEAAGGTHLGIGISAGEEGTIDTVDFTGELGGIGGHNNGWSVLSQGPKPHVCKGARLTIINCKFNNNNIEMQTYMNDADTPDSLKIIDCGGINTLSLGFTPPATVQNWKVEVVNSEIQNNEV